MHGFPPNPNDTAVSTKALARSREVTHRAGSCTNRGRQIGEGNLCKGCWWTLATAQEGFSKCGWRALCQVDFLPVPGCIALGAAAESDRSGINRRFGMT